jgi:ATP-dependent RNA helicase RhlE
MEKKNPVKIDSGGAFHEKKLKNLKVNMKLSRGDKMKLKYGKPKKRRNN